MYIGDVFALKIKIKGIEHVEAIYSNYMAAYEEGEKWIRMGKATFGNLSPIEYEIIVYEMRE
jgi:hypothetical protein